MSAGRPRTPSSLKATRAISQILVLHGAGSTAPTAHSLLRPLFPEAASIAWHGIDDRTGSVEVLVGAIGHWLSNLPTGGGRRLVCGISMGAHAAAIAAASSSRGRIDGLVLALPAWLGPPDQTSSATALTGNDILQLGRDRTFDLISHRAPLETRWLLDVLRYDWAQYSDEELAGALISAASGWGPTPEQLREVNIPAVVIGARDDPLHPARIARSWSQYLTGSRLVEVDIHRRGSLETNDTRSAVAQMWDEMAEGTQSMRQES